MNLNSFDFFNNVVLTFFGHYTHSLKIIVSKINENENSEYDICFMFY